MVYWDDSHCLNLFSKRALYKRLFPVTLPFGPHLVHDQFSLNTISTPDCKKTCNAAVPDIPLPCYKLNWLIPCDIPESWTVLSGAFLFCQVYILAHMQNLSDTRKLNAPEQVYFTHVWTVIEHYILHHIEPGKYIVVKVKYKLHLHFKVLFDKSDRKKTTTKIIINIVMILNFKLFSLWLVIEYW